MSITEILGNKLLEMVASKLGDVDGTFTIAKKPGEKTRVTISFTLGAKE